MQETSAIYRRILSTQDHWFESRVVIGESGRLITEGGEVILFGGQPIAVARQGPEWGFGEELVWSIETDQQMLKENVQLGQAIAGEINVKMFDPAGEVPRMSVVVPYIRACGVDDETGEEIYSEWLQQGTYFIDTREISDNEDGMKVLELHGFDAMMKAERFHTKTVTSTDVDLISSIASAMGVTVDPRTWDVVTEGYRFTVTPSYTMRETLCYIAGAYAGCFVMTAVGQLRLVSFFELPPETDYLVDEVGYAIVFGGDRILV